MTAAAARAFEELGAVVEPADPGFENPVEILNDLWSVGAWFLIRAIPEEQRGEVDPGLVAAAERGRAIAGADFVAAANARGALFTTMARFFDRYDLLLTPTLATPAFEVGHNVPPDGRFGDDWVDWTPYSYPFNLALLPAASVPCGQTRAGLPVGLQIVGPMRRETSFSRLRAPSRRFGPGRPWPNRA